MALSVADLTALKSLTVRPLTVEVQSGSALGFWQWEDNSTTPPNDTSVVQPIFGPPGRWKLFLQEVTSAVIIAALGYTPVNRAGDTMTGGLTLPGTVTLGYDANGAISLGGISKSPFIDFNSYSSLNDYDARIQTTGGLPGQDAGGTLNILAQTLLLNAQLVSAKVGVSVWLESAPYSAYGYSGGNRVYGQQAQGGAAITGASRLSDATGASSAPIGIMGWGFNDGGTTGSGAWGGYFEARKLVGAQALPTQGVEIDLADVSGAAITQITPDSPYAPNSTLALWVASGGGVAGAQSVSVALGIVYNGSTFEKGILVGETAINLVGGVRNAVALSATAQHRIGWWDAGSILSSVYCDLTGLISEGSERITSWLRVGSSSVPTSTGTGVITAEKMTLGDAGLTQVNLRISRTLTGATDSFSLYNNPTVQSDVTANASVYFSLPSTQATAFTLSRLNHFFAQTGTIGAGSIVSQQVGLAIDALTGATANFGIVSGISAAANNWNLYLNGTAQNYIAGNLGIGSGKDAPAVALDVAGAGAFTTTLSTGAPAGSSAGLWKFGALEAGAVTADTTRSIFVDIGGTVYKLIVAT